MKTVHHLTRLLAVLLLLSVLSACADQTPTDFVDASVFAAWEGSYSKENREKAIKEYAKDYIPVYAVNVEGDAVSFQIDFEPTDCGKVILAPVDDDTKGGELNTIADFTTEVMTDGNVVTVDISWWYDAAQAAKAHQQWSYLFWLKDTDGVNHYYYFRVVYK